jgi:hypothetical protein
MIPIELHINVELDDQTELLAAINENLVTIGGVVGSIFAVIMLVIVVKVSWGLFAGIFFRGA